MSLYNNLVFKIQNLLIQQTNNDTVLTNHVVSTTNQKFNFTILLISLLLFPIVIFGQVINLGSMENFVSFTANGAISNTGNSMLTGDIGTGEGSISGMGTAILNGSIYNDNTETAQAKIDLLNAYIILSALPVTNSSHAPAFGSGEVILAGVYSIGGAGSIAGSLTLDGQGNTNAFFVVKFEGAFTAAVGTIITLTNGASACNVFWLAEGAISVGATSAIKGTLIAHPGAVTMGADNTLDGRMFSTSGAISFGPGNASIPQGISTIPIACEPACSNPILGTVANFALFTSVGACTNTATSGIIGDVGSDAGPVNGFSSSVIVGSLHNADATTVQASVDLQNAYTQLFNTTTTNAAHTPAFGSEETLTGGVYSIAAAGSLAGNLILDGQGNTNATFIFKFDGAFTTAAQSKVILINGANHCNIFWVAEGAVSMGTFSYMKGTLIANNGANTMGANGNLEGRMLSTSGAIGFSTGVIYTSYFCSNPIALPIELISFTGSCDLQNTRLEWSTASEINNDYFSIERSLDVINWKLVSKVEGAGNSNSIKNYSYIYKEPTHEIYYYRLKQTDFNGQFEHSDIIATNKCDDDLTELAIYPNPANEAINLSYRGDKSQINSTTIYNALGEMVHHSEFYQSKIVLENKINGIYFLHLNLSSKIIIEKFIIAD